VVSIGGGGFTLPGYFHATRPGSSNVALEIDGPLVEINRAELALTDDTQVIVDDARMSLQRLSDDSADVVIGDAFSGASVPWHLTTVEFNREIRRVLTPGGVYAMNVIDYGSRDFVRSAAATLDEVFDRVALFAPDSYIDGSGGGNYVLVGSESPIDVAAIERTIQSRDGTERGFAGDRLAGFIDAAEPLVDDFAPVDQMIGSPGGT
jgi:spermidine synthase